MAGNYDPKKDYAAAIKKETDPKKKQQLINERQNKIDAMNKSGTNTKGYTNDIYKGSNKTSSNKTSSNKTSSGGSSDRGFDANKDYAAAIKNAQTQAEKDRLMAERQNKLNWLNQTGQNTKGYTNDIYKSGAGSTAPASQKEITPKGQYQNKDMGIWSGQQSSQQSGSFPSPTVTKAAATSFTPAAVTLPEYAQGTAAQQTTPEYAQGTDPVQQAAAQAFFARQKSNIDPADMAGVYTGDGSLSLPDQQLLKQYQALWNQGKATNNQAVMDAAHQKAEALRDNYRYYPLKNSNGYNLGENDIGFIRDMVVRGDELGNKYVDEYNGNSVTTTRYDKDGNFVNRHTGSIAGHNARVAQDMAATNARLAGQQRENNTFAVRVSDPAHANLSLGELAQTYGNPNNGLGQALYDDTALRERIANGQTAATEQFGYFDPNMDYAAAIAAEQDPARQAQLKQERQNKLNYLNATRQNPNGYTNAIYGQVNQTFLPTGQPTIQQAAGTGFTPAAAELPDYIGMSREEIDDAYSGIAAQLEAQRMAMAQQTQAQIQAAQETAGGEFDDLARQAYINKRQSEVALPQQLAALGISGGGSETANLQLQTNYQNNLNSNEQARQQMLKDYALQGLQAQMQANSDIAGYYANAKQNAMNAWQSEMANHNSWNQWLANYQMQQQQYQNELAQQQYQNQLAAQQYENELKQQQISLALQMGDYQKLAALGYDTTYLKRMQDAELEQLALDALYTKAQTAKMNSSIGSGSGGGNKKVIIKNDSGGDGDSGEPKGNDSLTKNGYTHLMMNYRLLGDTQAFEKKVKELMDSGAVSKADYNKFLENYY